MNNKDIYKNAVNQIHADEKLKNDTLKKVENNNRRGVTFARYLVACAVFVTVFAIGIIYLKDEKLKEKMQSQKEYYDFKSINETAGEAIEDMAPSSASSEGSTNNYSRTNIQVENVDEADIVKTDGKYIYYITKNKVYIIDAKSLKNVSELSILDKQKAFYPDELFINGDKLIVIGNLYENRQIDIDYEEDEVYYNYSRTASNNGTTAIIYDLSNIEKPKIEREIMVDGSYKTSRMIDDTVYFISSKYIYYYDDMKDDELLPSFKDTAVGDKEKSIECTDIAYFEETTYSNYLMVVGFKINNKEKANIETLYGAGEDFYVSDENLYITKSNYSSLFGIDITKHNPSVKPILFPMTCPSCDQKLDNRNGLWYCTNTLCPDQIIASITHFVSRGAMDIKSMGNNTIRVLVKFKLIKNIADIYDLDYDTLVNVPGFSNISVEKMVKEIEKSKNQSLGNVLFALGIPGVGKTAADNIVSKFHIIERIEQSTYDDLMTIPLIGSETAKNIVSFFKTAENIEMINRLKRHNVTALCSE